MVWQDYELISTKRVGYARRGFPSPLLRRQWSAFGGWQTVYMATFFGFAGNQFGIVQNSLVPLTTPVMSASGLRSIGRNGLQLAGPALVGVALGITTFGQPRELIHLLKNGFTFGREMKEVRSELFYT